VRGVERREGVEEEGLVNGLFHLRSMRAQGWLTG